MLKMWHISVHSHILQAKYVQDFFQQGEAAEETWREVKVLQFREIPEIL